MAQEALEQPARGLVNPPNGESLPPPWQYSSIWESWQLLVDSVSPGFHRCAAEILLPRSRLSYGGPERKNLYRVTVFNGQSFPNSSHDGGCFSTLEEAAAASMVLVARELL